MYQRAKKVVSDSPGLVDFVLNLSNRQVKFFCGIQITEELWIPKLFLLIKMIWGLVEMTFGLVYSSFSLPEWQALKVTFFAPCVYTLLCLSLWIQPSLGFLSEATIIVPARHYICKQLCINCIMHLKSSSHLCHYISISISFH